MLMRISVNDIDFPLCRICEVRVGEEVKVKFRRYGQHFNVLSTSYRSFKVLKIHSVFYDNGWRIEFDGEEVGEENV